MLPWNPPSSFSLGNDSQPQSQPPQSGAGQPRYTSPYHDSQPSPHQQPQQQQQQQQQQQPQQQQQQQQQQNQGPPQPANAAPYPPMTLAATLHFLQSEHRRYARDRNEWEIERAEMRARIALLEGEKRGNEGALKSLGRRCKMLEMALRGERSKFLSTTNALGTGTLGLTPSVSGTASPVPHLAQTLAPATAGAAGIPPAKLAVLQKEAGAPSTPVATTSEKESGSEKKDDVKEKDEKADEKDVPKSAPMQSSSSASGQAVPAKVESLSAANGFATGTWNNAAAAAAGLGNAGGVGAGGVRDPRGKARSREYLKQCLQEITYLTSSTTLNPLSLHSYAAPNVPRPRKSLPDHLPAPGAPGVLSIPSSSVPPSTTGIDDPPPPPLSQEKLREEELKEKEDKERKTDLLSSYPSDPPSAYVPLKRQISQPGQQGLRGVPPVGPRDAVPSLPTPPEVVIEEPTPVEGEVEAKEEEKETPAPLQDSDEFDRQIAELSSPEPLPRPTSIDSAASPSSAAAALEAEEEVLPTLIAAAATPQAAAADVVAVDELEGLPVAAAGEAVEEAEPTTPLSPGPKEGSSAEEGDKESTTTFSTSASDEAAEEALSSSPSPPSAIVPSILDDAALPAPAPLASAETTSADLDAAESAAEVGESAAKIDEEEEETPEEAFEPVGESSLKKEVEGKKEEQKETEKKEKEEELVAASDPGKQDSSIGVTSAAGGGAGVDGSRDGGEARLSREDFAEGEQGGEGGDFGLIASSAVLSESGTNGERGASAREGEAEEAEETGGGEPIAALYRPASEEEWRAKLAEAGRRAYPSLHASASSAAGGGGGGDKELESLSWDLDVESPPSSEDGSVGKKTAKNGHGKKEGKKEPSEDATLTGLQEKERWRARRVLKSHLECVRAVAITEGGEGGGEVVVSGGDDGTVKVWRGVVGGKSGSRSDIEPVATLRGHTAPITALAVSSPSIIFSASLDSTIRLWRLPSPSASIYDPHDPSLALATLEPRSDAAWGIVELEKDRIAAIFADGSVQVWDWRTEEKVRGWEYCGVESSPSSFSPGGSQKKRPTALPISTCIVVLRPEFEDIFGDDDTKLEWGKEYLVVGYQNSVVKIFEAETGKEKRSFAMDETTDGTPDTQINAIAVEPYHGLIATAHEDRYIRIVEINSGQHLVSTIAHLDGVTSLSFTDPGSGSSRYRSATLASTSHDVSLRIWNVSYNYEEYPLTEIEFTCVQEASTHRVKGAEGVLGLAVREGGRVAVTAGADGTVRVWER